MLRLAFERVLGPAVAAEVRINTIDSFQGKELDVVIFSCVRAASAASAASARSLLGAPPLPAAAGCCPCGWCCTCARQVLHAGWVELEWL